MINKLKTEFNYHWISKLEDMFKDMKRSMFFMKEFNKKYSNNFNIKLNVSVCTIGSWPTSSIKHVKKPQDIVQISDRFTQFYINRFTRRQLNFQMDKGKAEVSVQFNAQTNKILIVSTYQMIILLQFNNKNTLTFKNLIDLTGIPRKELIVAVISMAHPKVKIMKKAPNTPYIQDSHKFQINPKYANSIKRIPIPTLNIKRKTLEKFDEKQMEMKSIYRLRKYQIDTAIVRIMKIHKKLKHPDLFTQVVKRLKRYFIPKPVHIKKSITILIENEYLERDEQDRELYHYIP